MRDSSVCMLQKETSACSEVVFGSIIKFCLVGGTPVAILAVFMPTNEVILSTSGSRGRSSLQPDDDLKAVILLCLK